MRAMYRVTRASRWDFRDRASAVEISSLEEEGEEGRWGKEALMWVRAR